MNQPNQPPTETLPTLATVTAAQIAAMPADSVALRVLCAEAMRILFTRIAQPGEVVKPGDRHITLKFNPAQNPADSSAARAWMRGEGYPVSVDDNHWPGFVSDKPFVVGVFTKGAEGNVIGYGTTEDHATALALAEYGRRKAQGEL